MLNVGIIDDDTTLLAKMEVICIEYFNNKNHTVRVQSFSSTNEFLNSEIIYDIVFLDIELPEFNGIEIAEMIRNIDKECCICFISNHSKYAIKSFHVHAFDFIEKPININRIHRTLDELFAYHGIKIMNKTKVTLPLNNYSNIALVINEILYFEYFDTSSDYLNRTTVVFTHNNKYALKMKISGVFNLLQMDLFSMPHKSYIVNFINVSLIKGNEIIMKNGTIIPLSQKRATKFRKDFNNYIKKYFIG